MKAQRETEQLPIDYDAQLKEHRVYVKFEDVAHDCGQLPTCDNNPKAPLYIVNAKHQIYLFNYTSGQLLCTFDGHSRLMQSQCVISLGNNTVVSADYDRKIRVWSIPETTEPTEKKRSLFSKRKSSSINQDEIKGKQLHCVTEPDNTPSLLAPMTNQTFVSVNLSKSNTIKFWRVTEEGINCFQSWPTEHPINAICSVNDSSVRFLSYQFKQPISHQFIIYEHSNAGCQALFQYNHSISITKPLSLSQCFLRRNFAIFFDSGKGNGYSLQAIYCDEANASMSTKSVSYTEKKDDRKCFLSTLGFFGRLSKTDKDHKITVYECALKKQ